jgi:hypothetical protein
MPFLETQRLVPEDFPELVRLEEGVFFAGGEAVRGPHYLRLCCEVFGDTCFVTRSRGQAVGMLLAFARGRRLFCSTLAVDPSFPARRAVTTSLLGAFVRDALPRSDEAWFAIAREDARTRALCEALGGVDAGVRRDFYGVGADRILMSVDRHAPERHRLRYERLGLLDAPTFAQP